MTSAKQVEAAAVKNKDKDAAGATMSAGCGTPSGLVSTHSGALQLHSSCVPNRSGTCWRQCQRSPTQKFWPFFVDPWTQGSVRIVFPWQWNAEIYRDSLDISPVFLGVAHGDNSLFSFTSS
jgi:hypothetical protein